MQGLILAGILWLANSVSSQNASIAGMQVKLADIKLTFEGVPAIKDRITVLEQKQSDLLHEFGSYSRERRFPNGYFKLMETKLSSPMGLTQSFVRMNLISYFL